MSEQAKALELADLIEQLDAADLELPLDEMAPVAAELRRLHEVNAELLEALQAVDVSAVLIPGTNGSEAAISRVVLDMVRTAIARFASPCVAANTITRAGGSATSIALKNLYAEYIRLHGCFPLPSNGGYRAMVEAKAALDAEGAAQDAISRALSQSKGE